MAEAACCPSTRKEGSAHKPPFFLYRADGDGAQLAGGVPLRQLFTQAHGVTLLLAKLRYHRSSGPYTSTENLVLLTIPLIHVLSGGQG